MLIEAWSKRHGEGDRMRAQPGGTRRYGTSSLALATGLTLCCAACGGGSSSGGSSKPIEFTPGAMQSVPALKTAGSTSGLAALTSPRSSAASVRDYFFVAQLFEMQCRHRDSGASYCPPGTPAPPSGTADPYQFTMQALIGFIYHAQMYTSLVTDCSGGDVTPKAISASSYSAAKAASGANPTRFLLDQFSSYACRSSGVSNGGAETRMVSAVPDGSYQTTLHTRYKYDSGDGRPQTDFFQIDVTMEARTPTFLAVNFAAAEPYRSRLVLLANLATHRFALKYYVPSQPSNLPTWAPEHFAVALGVGGYDLTTGTPNPGHYYVDFLDEPPYGEMKRCVDNADGSLLADFTGCTADGVPMQWSGSDAIRSYLGVPDANAARLAPFLAKFLDATTLGASDAWQNIGDEDLYWPASLH
jgi:hypothetical protein